MRKLLVTFILLCLATPLQAGADNGSGEGKALKPAAVKQKKRKAKKSTEQLRRQGERDAARHKAEAMRREYQLMMEAQQRGMRQRPP